MADVKQKYLTDEIGDRFSPVTSSDSIWVPRGGAMFVYQTCLKIAGKI